MAAHTRESDSAGWSVRPHYQTEVCSLSVSPFASARLRKIHDSWQNGADADHIFARLTHITTHFRRSTMIFSGISTIFCACLKRRRYESIWDSGEVMRRKAVSSPASPSRGRTGVKGIKIF